MVLVAAYSKDDLSIKRNREGREVSIAATYHVTHPHIDLVELRSYPTILILMGSRSLLSIWVPSYLAPPGHPSDNMSF